MIREDNQCPFFFAGNLQVSQLTKRIDTKFFYQRIHFYEKQSIPGKLLKIVTKDNTVGFRTKNIDVSTFERPKKEVDGGIQIRIRMLRKYITK